MRFLSRFLLCVLACPALISCATPTVKLLQPTGGSRADGTIKMSYQVEMFEKPMVQWALAQQTAADKCKAWGYQSAEAFGGQQTYCQAVNGFGDCASTIVTVTYQCTGAPTSSK